MSAIHKALSQDNVGYSVDSTAGFNPLAKKTKHSRFFNWQVAIIALLLCATAIVVFWPTRSIETAIPAIVPEDSSAQAGQTESVATAEAKEPDSNSVVLNEPTSEIDTSATTVDISNESISEGKASETEAETALPDDSVNLQLAVKPEQTTPAQTETTQSQTATTQALGNTESISTVDKANPAPSSESSIQPSVTTAVSQGENTEVTADSSTVNPSVGDLNAESNVGVIRQSQNNWKAQVEAHIAAGEIEQAEALLKTWISTIPDDSTARIWLAKIYINNGFLRAAEPLLKPINDTEAKALLGLIYERTNRPLPAATLFEELFRANPAEGKWLLFWAVNTENLGELAKSRTLYQNYLTLFSQNDANLTQFADRRLRALQGQ